MINDNYKMGKIILMKNKFRTVTTNSFIIRRFFYIASIVCSFSYFSVHAQSKILTVKANDIKADVAPTMWGVFFEDINMGADGGIYAELIKNRSFEFYRPLMGWKVLGKPLTEGDFLVLNRQKVNTANPRFFACYPSQQHKRKSWSFE